MKIVEDVLTWAWVAFFTGVAVAGCTKNLTELQSKSTGEKVQEKLQTIRVHASESKAALKTIRVEGKPVAPTDQRLKTIEVHQTEIIKNVDIVKQPVSNLTATAASVTTPESRWVVGFRWLGFGSFCLIPIAIIVAKLTGGVLAARVALAGVVGVLAAMVFQYVVGVVILTLKITTGVGVLAGVGYIVYERVRAGSWKKTFFHIKNDLTPASNSKGKK